MPITLNAVQELLRAALLYARENNLQPIAVAVLDERSILKGFVAEDGTSIARADIAMGKANGALSMGLGSRTLAKRARDTPNFFNALSHVVRGGLIPGPGGVLIRNSDGELLGAVGISGDAADQDEAAALAGIQAAGLVGDPGSD